MILLSGNNSKTDDLALIGGLIIIGVNFLLFALPIIWMVVSQSSYMRKQKKTGADKKRVMDLMQRFMGERFFDYQYIVGYYTKKEPKFGKVILYYNPYILAFSDTEIIIFSFLVKNGEIILRNRLDINWQEIGMNYFVNSCKTAFLRFYIEEDWLYINVSRVISSSGAEKSDKPLGIYQEQETSRFIKLLPLYKSYCKYSVK